LLEQTVLLTDGSKPVIYSNQTNSTARNALKSPYRIQSFQTALIEAKVEYARWHVLHIGQIRMLK